jgi:predicted transcriptional regulator
MKKQIKIGVADDVSSAKGFVDAWKRAERGEKAIVDQKLTFENLETLLRTLTAKRWELLKNLRRKGPLSIRALSKNLGRDYKNVHTDTSVLLNLGLIERTQDEKIKVPWDIVEARLKLAA